MSRNRKVALVLMIAVLAVPTSYFALQFWNVVAYHEYRKGLIVQARLIELKYVIDSSAIEKGYFTCNLTFSNPTPETLTLNVLYVDCWESPLRWRQYLIAFGEGITDENLSPGTTQVLVRLDFNPDYTDDVLLVQQPIWDISFSPKLRPTAYTMKATVQNSTIQTEGPSYAWGIDETESTLVTYMVSIVALWAIPSEILAAVIIFQGRKAEGAALLHDKMLSIIYCTQGFGFIVASLWGTIFKVLIPPLPPPDFYYSSFASAFAAVFLFVFALSISAVFFLAAYGYLRKRDWAKKVAFPLSLLSLFVWSYVEFHLLTAWFFEGLSTMYYLSLIFLTLGLALANAIAVYVLVWRGMFSRRV